MFLVGGIVIHKEQISIFDNNNNNNNNNNNSKNDDNNIIIIIMIMMVMINTEFFPSFYGPSAKRAGHEKKEGKNEDP